MMRINAILISLFMLSCTTEVSSNSIEAEVVSPIETQQNISKTVSPEPADVTAKRFIVENTKNKNLSKCKIERSDKQIIPTEFKLVSTSPNGKNALYSDGGFLGGDHNVFDEITGVIKGDGHKAIIVTPSETIMITAKGAGIGINFRGGKLQCNGISKF